MLPGIAGVMPAVASGPAGISASYLSLEVDPSPGTTSEFVDYAIGDAAADRRVFLAVHWVEGSTHRTISSATIGGVSATIHIQEGHSGGVTGFGVAIISAIVPTGTTATVVVNFSGNKTDTTIGGIRVTGLSNSSPHATAVDENEGTASSLAVSINVPEDGLLIGAYSSSTNATLRAVTWGGVTEEYDQSSGGIRVSMGWDYELSEETGRSVSASISSIGDSGNALVVVSWN